MKNISLITLNIPGLEAAIATAYDLTRVNKNFRLNIYYKQGNINDSFNFLRFENIDEVIEKVWKSSDAIIWFVSTGIIIRKIAPLLNSKVIDPANIVINLDRTQIIPLLSNHIGGANKLVTDLCSVNKALAPFITTATDSLDIFAFDNFAKAHGYEILNIKELAKISNALVNKRKVNLISYPVISEKVKAEPVSADNIAFINIQDDNFAIKADIPTVIVTPFSKVNSGNLCIKIKPISVGIGLNRGISFEELQRDLLSFSQENSLQIEDIDVFHLFIAKKDESGLIELAQYYNKKLEFFDENDINNLENHFSQSKAQDYFNIKGVAEPCAVLASNLKTLFVNKQIYKNTTFAAAFLKGENMHTGELYIVSTGMGNPSQLTQNAYTALQKADLIVGYDKYIKDISSVICAKKVFSTGMTQEVERCKYAIKQALEGQKVAVISNGDANVYGMAGLVLELIDYNNCWDDIDITIEPGVTAFLAAAAKVGAPLMNDFAVISLSNLLTPMELIEKRLKNALEADFILGIYNPLSHSRKEPYQKFLQQLREHRKDNVPVVIAQNIGRDNEKVVINTVEELYSEGLNHDLVNMSTILIIGNSYSRLSSNNKYVITQRGYEQSYDYKL